jgi:hypothetical protein
MIDYDELLDFIEDNGLNERQTIGTLLDCLDEEGSEEEDDERDD